MAGFNASEKQQILALKGVGATVISRLEQSGAYYSIGTKLNQGLNNDFCND